MGRASGEPPSARRHADPHPDAHADRVQSLVARVRALDTRREADVDPDDDVWTGDPKLGDRVSNRVDALALRVETLSETVRATASGLGGRERELVTLRRELADAHARVDSALRDLQTRVDPEPVRELQRATAILTEDVSTLRQGHDAAVARLDSLTDTAAVARTSITAHERAIGELSDAVEAGNTRVDSVVGVVRQAVESLVAQIDNDGERAASTRSAMLLEQRLDALSGTVASLAEAVESLSEASADRELELAAAYHRLEEKLDQLAPTPEPIPRKLSVSAPEEPRGEFDDELARRRALIDEVRAHLAASDRQRFGTSEP